MRRTLEIIEDALGEGKAYWRPKRLRLKRTGKGRTHPEERVKPMKKKGKK